MILCFGTTPAIARTMRFGKLDLGGVNRTAEVYAYAAGKAVNAARAIHTLGAEVRCVGPLGGMLGNDLRALLERDGLCHDFVESDAATRLCVTVIDEATGRATELIEDAPPMSEADGEALLRRLESELEAAPAVAVFSGSLARGLDAGYHARCIASARARGARVVLDASGEPLRQALQAKPDVVKINAEELAGLSGTGKLGSSDELMRQTLDLARRIEGVAIITRGSESTLAADHAGTLWRVLPVAARRVQSPIGSGDCFAAGVAVAMSRGEPLERWLTLGTACAVANVESPHAAHVDPQAIARYREQCTVLRGS